MPRRGENIYKRKDGRWEGRYIKQYDIKGKAQYGYIYGKTYTAVKKLLAEKQIKNIKPEKIRTGSVYKDILVSWLESQRLNKKESIYAHYYQIIHTHLIPDIGFIKIERMSTKLVEKYITQLLESGRIDGTGGLSAKTVSDILAIIKATIEYANYNDWTIISMSPSLTKSTEPISSSCSMMLAQFQISLLQQMPSSSKKLIRSFLRNTNGSALNSYMMKAERAIG